MCNRRTKIATRWPFFQVLIDVCQMKTLLSPWFMKQYRLFYSCFSFHSKTDGCADMPRFFFLRLFSSLPRPFVWLLIYVSFIILWVFTRFFFFFNIISWVLTEKKERCGGLATPFGCSRSSLTEKPLVYQNGHAPACPYLLVLFPLFFFSEWNTASLRKEEKKKENQIRKKVFSCSDCSFLWMI